MTARILGLTLAALATLTAATASLASNVVPDNFIGAGTMVNGFQDFFTGTTLNPNYLEISGGAPVTLGSSGNFTLPGDGTLHINGGGGDPNKLLYNGPAYSGTNQNVLAMIEVTSSGTGGDGFRGGVGAQSSAANGQGINDLFRVDGNNGTGNHMNLLNDSLAWGPSIGSSTSPAWSLNSFYWVREVTSGSSITASIWPANGVTPESAAMSTTWTQGGRSGLAGLVGDSSGGNGTFQVNYLLIQSAGLPLIQAVPEPSTFILGGLGVIGLMLASRRRGKAQSISTLKPQKDMMTKRIFGLAVALFAIVAVASQSAHAAAIGTLTNEQYNASTDGNNNESSLTVVTAGDLILGKSFTNTNYVGNNEAAGGTTAPFTDGTTGVGTNAGTNNTNALFDLNAGTQPWYVEYQLPTSGAPYGYDLTSTTIFSGHQDGRVNQSYDILVSKDGVHFTSLGDGSSQALGTPGGTPFAYTPSNNGIGGAAESTVSPISGLILGSGIRFVEFVDQSGGGNDIYREFAVYGNITTPEPSSFVLGGLGVVGLLVAARRRRKA